MDNIKLIAILCAVTLAGCSTQPATNNQSRPVAAERLLSTHYLAPTAESGQVTIRRDPGIWGVGCTPTIYINAEEIARLRPDEKVVLHLPADTYIISARSSKACGNNLAEAGIESIAGTEQTWRIGYGSSGELVLQPTAF